MLIFDLHVIVTSFADRQQVYLPSSCWLWVQRSLYFCKALPLGCSLPPAVHRVTNFNS